MGGREGGTEGGWGSRSVSQFYPSIILSSNAYLLTQRRIKDPVVPKHFPQAHGATKDAAKRHILSENDLWK